MRCQSKPGLQAHYIALLYHHEFGIHCLQSEHCSGTSSILPQRKESCRKKINLSKNNNTKLILIKSTKDLFRFNPNP